MRRNCEQSLSCFPAATWEFNLAATCSAVAASLSCSTAWPLFRRSCLKCCCLFRQAHSQPAGSAHLIWLLSRGPAACRQASRDSPFSAPGVLTSPYNYVVPEDRSGQVVFADPAQPGGHAFSQLDAEMAELISEGVVGERPSGKISMMTDHISSEFVIPEDAPPEEVRAHNAQEAVSALAH